MTVPVTTTPTTPAPAPDVSPERPAAREMIDGPEFAKMFGLAPEQTEAPTPDTSTPAPEAEAQAEPENTVVPTPEAVAEPTPAPATPTVEANQKLATDFKVFDPEGELEIPALTLEFKANGEVRKEPLDKVVRLAQMGLYNEQREAQVVASKQFVQQTQQENESLKGENTEYKSFFERVMSGDDQFLASARQNYAAQMSPEAQLRRTQQQLQEVQQGKDAVATNQRIAAFAQTVLLPKMAEMMQKYPTVSQEALLGRYSLLTAPLMVGGVIPEARHPEVQRIVEHELAQWAEQVHGASQQTAADTKKQVDAAKVQTTLAKRRLAQATKPVAGSGTAPIRENTAPRQFKSVNDWLDSSDGLAASIQQGMGGG